MKKFLFCALILTLFSSAYAQRIVNRIYLTSYTKTQIDSILGANGIPNVLGTAYDIDVYRIIYNTVNYDSTLITASGMLAVPHNTTCRFPLAAYEHGTVTAKHDAPSYLNGQEPMIGMVMASVGFIVVEPDYLGLGDGPGIHPYQHDKTEASASIDMLRSAREFCDSAGVKQNGQLFLMGYSEGGHACMSTQRAIEQKLQGEMTVTASVPMSGAYDMSGVMINRMLTDTPYSQPAYLAYLVISWNPIYHLCDSFSQTFVHPYDSILPILLGGNYGTNTVNNAMPSIPKRIFTTAELDTFVNNPNSVMRMALRDNDNFDWAPQAPTRIFFCKGDTYVPYQNSCVAINKLKQNGCADCDTMDINPDLDHVPCAQFSILQAKQFFDRYRFIDCTNGIDNISEQAIVSVYPNPAHDRFNVEIYQAGEFASASMYDAMGRLVKTVALSRGVNAISTDALATGVYLVRVSDEKGLNKVTRVTVTK